MAKFEKGSKEIVQFIASLIVLAAGIALIFMGFWAVPIGQIHYTVISTFGVFLSFVGAVWNIDIKYQYKTKELESRFVEVKDKKEDAL